MGCRWAAVGATVERPLQSRQAATGISRSGGDRQEDRWVSTVRPMGVQETKQQVSSISVTSLMDQAESHGADMGMTLHFRKHVDGRFAKLVRHRLAGCPSAAGCTPVRKRLVQKLFAKTFVPVHKFLQTVF